MPVGHKRQPSEAERDRTRIAALYLKGVPQYTIAEEVGVAIQTVSNDLKIIQKRWIRQQTSALGEVKSRELAKLDLLEIEYWKAWKRSQAVQKKIKTEDAIGEDETKRIKETVERTKPVGDPRFLEGVERCIKQRVEIMGLGAPSVNFNVNMEELSWEQLERISNGEDWRDVLSSYGAPLVLEPASDINNSTSDLDNSENKDPESRSSTEPGSEDRSENGSENE